MPSATTRLPEMSEQGQGKTNHTTDSVSINNINQEVLARKIAIFNGVGFLASTLGITIVDALLTTRDEYRDRHYPLGYGVSVASLVVMAIMYAGMRRASRLSPSALLAACTPLIIACPLMYFFFQPEFPHPLIGGWAFIYSMINIVLLWIQFTEVPRDYVQQADIPLQAKIERAKEEIGFWRSISIALASAYIGIIVSCLTIQLNSAEKIVKSSHDLQRILGLNTVLIYVLTAYLVIVGFYEIVRKTREAMNVLLSIPREK